MPAGFFMKTIMPLVIFTKNMMTDGGPAKAHSVGRVSTERQGGVIWQTYYQMPFDVELSGHTYQEAAKWLIANEPAFAGSEMVVPGTAEQTQEGDEE